jgi:hypothetical protein
MKVEKDLLEARRRQSQSSYRIGIASEIVAGVLGGALVILAWHLLRRDFVARLQASAALGQLEVLMASAPVGIAFLDREMRYGSINAHLAEINGFPVEAHISVGSQQKFPASARKQKDCFAKFWRVWIPS